MFWPQLMAAARKRMDAGRAREAAGRGFAEANAGMTRTSEAEKTFTSQVRDSFSVPGNLDYLRNQRIPKS